MDAELPAQHAPLADPAKDMSDNLMPTETRADGAHEDESDGPPAQHTTQVNLPSRQGEHFEIAHCELARRRATTA